MSCDAMSWVDAQNVRCEKKFVLLMLSDSASHTHTVNLRSGFEANLARRCGLEVEEVKDAIKWLIDNRYLWPTFPEVSGYDLAFRFPIEQREAV